MERRRRLRSARDRIGTCEDPPGKHSSDQHVGQSSTKHRSPALFVGGWALQQLWLFWVAPLIGGVLGGVIYRWLSDEPTGVVEGKTTA